MLFSEKDLKIVPHSEKTYRFFRPFSVPQIKNIINRWYDTPQLRPTHSDATVDIYYKDKLKKQDIVDLMLHHDWSDGFHAVQLAYLETRGIAMNKRPKKWTVLKALSNDGKLRLNQEPSTMQSQLYNFLSEFYDCYLYTYYEKRTQMFWTRVQLSPIDRIEVSARANVTSVGYMVYNPSVEYMMYTGKLYTADLKCLKEATMEVFSGDKLMVQTLNSDVVQYLQHVIEGRTSKQLAPLLIQQQQLQLQAEYDQDDDNDEDAGEEDVDRLKLVNNSLSSNPLDIRQRQDPALSLLHNDNWEFENPAERLVRERQKRLKNLTEQKDHKERVRGALQVLGLGKFYGITELDIDVKLPFQANDDASTTEDADTQPATNDKKAPVPFRMEMRGSNIPRGIRELIEMGKIGPQLPSWLTSNVGYTNATKLRVTEEGVKELNGLEDEEQDEEKEEAEEYNDGTTDIRDGNEMEEDRSVGHITPDKATEQEEMDIEQAETPNLSAVEFKGNEDADARSKGDDDNEEDALMKGQ